MSLPGQETSGPAPGEDEIAHFERILRQAEQDKARRFLEWNREHMLRDRS